jgi:hypothetical protein
MTIVACLLAIIGVSRIISTYHVFSQSTDEPDSVAPGMEWLQYGTYTFEPLHPPLARVAASIGPYLAGLRLKDHRNLWIEGNEVLQSNGRYLHNLALARVGILPFFVLATFLVWYWARSRYGDAPALIAVFLFTTTPIILGHAGMATTDTAEMATFTLAVFVFINFLERPTLLRAAIVGAATGLAIIAKFSGLPFLVASFAALLLCSLLLARQRLGIRSPSTSGWCWVHACVLAAVASCLVIWAGYRFSMGSAATAADRPHYTIDQIIGTHGALHDAAYRIAEMPLVPAPAFFQGLAKVRFKNYQGHKSYLLGDVRQTGWWYFFPVAFAVKTTIPLMIFTAVGVFYLCKSGWQERDWVIAAPVIVSAAVFLVCLKSQINIGVRHLLPIYPLLAITGGVAAYRLWQTTTGKYLARTLIVALLAWQLVASIRSHPDYLAYFNEFAGSHPEKILIDSDLDWGQDLLRLSSALHERHIEQVSVAYAGSKNLDLNNFGLPSFRVLPPHQPTTGWIAISLFCLKVGELGEPVDSYSWLQAYQPVARVGRSIFLYYIPEQSTARASVHWSARRARFIRPKLRMQSGWPCSFESQGSPARSNHFVTRDPKV